MAELIEVGDPVMVAFLGAVFHCYIERTHRGGFFTSSPETQHDRELSDEGTTWIRGHHAQDSNEARALIAAYCLLGK